MSGATRIRVLHVFHTMDRGGAETWIVNVLRHIDRERFQFDFLLESDRPGAYDAEIRALGGRLHHAGSPRNLVRFATAFRRIVREHGPYDVIHSHVHHSSGIMLALAAWQGIPARIAHSHSNIDSVRAQASLPRRAYYRGTEGLIHRFATVGLAASRDAAASLYGDTWERDSRYRVLHCGIVLTPFARQVDRAAVRERFGIAPDAFVVGHVGRFMPMKNHAFLVDVFAEVHAAQPNARLLLVGDGPLWGEIERRVRDRGLTGAVVFAGVQAEVPEILMGAMDVFAFPSTYEGLGLAVVEAQAAGLPCLISDAVPVESILDSDQVQRLPLGGDHARWASSVLNQRGAIHEFGAGRAIERASESPFSLRTGIDALKCAYLGH
jgi:glycosyltransferase involved in cell wall biosynthesis